MKVNKLLTIACHKYVSSETSEKNNFVWNMIGSMIFAAASMILSLLIIRIVGEDDGGIFAIAITVAQMLAFIEYYETRTFQVTDTKSTFEFGHYKAVKYILFVVSVVVSIVYSILTAIYRFVDAYADLYEGTFQKDGRLDLTGKSQAFRTVMSVTVMLVVLIITKNMILAISLSILIAILGLIIFDVMPMKTFRNIAVIWNEKYILGILKNCFPLFIGSFLWSYILSASRIAIDAKMASNYSAYFQTLFMPVSIVNLFATFVMKPALTKLADEYASDYKKPFIVSISKISVIIVGFTIICIIGAWILGIPVLQILTGSELIQYKMVLILLMFAGGINALSYFGYYVLTVMRKSGMIIIGYIVSAIVAKLANEYLVARYGIKGGAYGFLTSVMVLFLIFYFCIIYTILKKNTKRD